MSFLFLGHTLMMLPMKLGKKEEQVCKGRGKIMNLFLDIMKLGYP